MVDSLLPALVIEPQAPHQGSMFLLHGLGADGYDFEPIVAALSIPPTLGVRFILLHAPHRPVTVNQGEVMRAWYDLAGGDPGRKPDLRGIADSVAELLRWVEREKASGVSPERILLAGFSQGAVIALDAACRHPDRVGGVIALSGYLAEPEGLRMLRPALPVFLAHGRDDAVVPFRLGRAARQRLEELGHAVEWHAYDLPHSVSLEEIRDIRSWILRRWQFDE